MKKQLTGKVAFITGGSRGMGAAIAIRLAADGADVVITHSGKNSKKADAVVAAIHSANVNGMAIEARNENPAQIIAALETTLRDFGRIDILVNNAGIYMNKPLDEYTLDDYDTMMDVNVKAVFVASQFVARHMQKGGRIITIGSNLAERVADSGNTLYAMSKSALLGITRGMSRDLGPRQITVNLVQPGPVDTDMNPADSDFAPLLTSFMSIGRYGTVAEIAELVAYLAADGSHLVNGASIIIDGGFNA